MKSRKYPSTIYRTYPGGIGFAFHRAGGAGENTKKTEEYNDND